jgi:hypothetical protein
MDITVGPAINDLASSLNKTPASVSPLQDTSSHNVNKIMVSPDPNSNLCLMFTPLLSGEVVCLLLFIMLASESILIKLLDSRDHNQPRTWCFGRPIGSNACVLSQAHFSSTRPKGGNTTLYSEFIRTETSPSAWCCPNWPNAYPASAWHHFSFWVGLPDRARDWQREQDTHGRKSAGSYILITYVDITHRQQEYEEIKASRLRLKVHLLCAYKDVYSNSHHLSLALG